MKTKTLRAATSSLKMIDQVKKNNELMKDLELYKITQNTTLNQLKTENNKEEEEDMSFLLKTLLNNNNDKFDIENLPFVVPKANKPEYCLWRDWKYLWSI
mmetsp:Transcript_2138/g.3092  ORF Transcript_2138/g.3092 Transcript_2138/m.3092 type:complete len:100 (+) Transcript_2138:99-398(+)